MLNMNSTHTLPKRLGSDVPSCGANTNDRLSLGHLKYKLALKISEGYKLHEPNVVLQK